jgi:hypothetical protein
MSKTPFYKTGISNSPFHTHEPGHNEDPRAGLDPRFQYSDSGRPVNIIDSRGGWKPGQKTVTDAKSGTGMFDPNLESNKSWAGFIRTGGTDARKISGEEFGNLTFKDVQKMNLQQINIPGQDPQRFSGSTTRRSNTFDNYGGSSKSLTKSEFKSMQRSYKKHLFNRTQNATMQQNAIDYADAGGELRKPQPTKT